MIDMLKQIDEGEKKSKQNGRCMHTWCDAACMHDGASTTDVAKDQAIS
jgi:hypothetical protein